MDSDLDCDHQRSGAAPNVVGVRRGEKWREPHVRSGPISVIPKQGDNFRRLIASPEGSGQSIVAAQASTGKEVRT